MELKIAAEQTGHLMTDLGISQSRCEELCGVIETSITELHAKKPKEKSLTLAQVVQQAIRHTTTEQERVFVSITAGEYFTHYSTFVRERMSNDGGLAALLRQMMSN